MIFNGDIEIVKEIFEEYGLTLTREEIQGMEQYETVAQSYINEGIRTEKDRIIKRLIKELGISEAKAKELVGEDKSSTDK